MSHPDLTSADPTTWARTLAACPDLWAPVVEHAPGHRVHVRLAAGSGWEAYLITWPSGHGVELHDHGGSSGAVAVLTGDLVELVASPASKRAAQTSPPASERAAQTSPPASERAAQTGSASRLVRHRLPAGTVRRVPPRRIHDVVNAGPDPATSIHVYGPALETMTFYDDELRPVRTERVFPEAPRLALAEVEDHLRRSVTPA